MQLGAVFPSVYRLRLRNTGSHIVRDRSRIAFVSPIHGDVVDSIFFEWKHLTSRQIDLIIYDDASPILFNEGDLVILTADAVREIIEVKNDLENQILSNVISRANENGKFILSGKRNKNCTAKANLKNRPKANNKLITLDGF